MWYLPWDWVGVRYQYQVLSVWSKVCTSFLKEAIFYACGSQVTRQDIQWSTIYVYECLNIPKDLVIPIGLILFQWSDNFNHLCLDDSKIRLGLTHWKPFDSDSRPFIGGLPFKITRGTQETKLKLNFTESDSYSDSRVSEDPLLKQSLLLDY